MRVRVRMVGGGDGHKVPSSRLSRFLERTSEIQNDEKRGKHITQCHYWMIIYGAALVVCGQAV